MNLSHRGETWVRVGDQYQWQDWCFLGELWLPEELSLETGFKHADGCKILCISLILWDTEQFLFFFFTTTIKQVPTPWQHRERSLFLRKWHYLKNEVLLRTSKYDQVFLKISEFKFFCCPWEKRGYTFSSHASVYMSMYTSTYMCLCTYVCTHTHRVHRCATQHNILIFPITSYCPRADWIQVAS